MPATAGPTTRAALNIEEFRAMALTRSSLPTISTMKDWRVGMSKALTTPSREASAITFQTAIVCVQYRIASANACSMESVWVSTTMRRLSLRSATTPA